MAKSQWENQETGVEKPPAAPSPGTLRSVRVPCVSPLSDTSSCPSKVRGGARMAGGMLTGAFTTSTETPSVL
ncbi:hypothetical protein ACN47A_40840 [Myxococcus fulvus]|uniref:hypothetical protein n=1 Tax=Myxococcus fulvus TaxID=33 RepID=UPI003B9BE133